MKRLFVLFLIFCLLLSLAACAGTAAAPETGKSPAETAAPETGRPAADAPAGSPAGTGAPDINSYGEGEGSVEAEPGLALPELAGDAGTSFFYSISGKSADSAAGSALYGEGGAPTVPGGMGEGGDPTPGDAPADGDEPGDGDDPVVSEPTVVIETRPYDPGEALKLTAAEWNDNENWPFFTNLVNAGTISFPSFGLDPRNRIAVTVTDAAGAALANETVALLDAGGAVLWTARTDRTGTALVFFSGDQTPDRVVCGEVSAQVQVPEPSADPQGKAAMRPLEAVTLTAAPAAPAQRGLQVMFIVDTTGSMTDEISYLQKDFSAIAERVGSDGVQWSVSFYRDEGDDYVTRHNPFTSDVAEIQRKINAEYADGGGDTPEAVAEVLTECLTDRTDWDESCVKLAFLIFDAPPHEGREEALQAAVRAAAGKGIKVIPVVASNAERDTELFGRALAILTNGTYVFLTDDSGVGDSHLEPIVGDYDVELLQDLIVRLILAEKP